MLERPRWLIEPPGVGRAAQTCRAHRGSSVPGQDMRKGTGRSELGPSGTDLVPLIWAAAHTASPYFPTTHLRPNRRARAPARRTYLERGPGLPVHPPSPAGGALCAPTSTNLSSGLNARLLVACPPHRSAPSDGAWHTCSSLPGPGGCCGPPPAPHRAHHPAARSGFTPADRATRPIPQRDT